MAKILVIDSEKQICEWLQKILSSQGHEVLMTMDSSEGLRLFYQHHPDVMITDVFIPKKNEIMVIPELLYGNENTAVIVITDGRCNVKTELTQLSVIKGFLLKPFNFTQLLRIVHEVTN